MCKNILQYSVYQYSVVHSWSMKQEPVSSDLCLCPGIPAPVPVSPLCSWSRANVHLCHLPWLWRCTSLVPSESGFGSTGLMFSHFGCLNSFPPHLQMWVFSALCSPAITVFSLLIPLPVCACACARVRACQPTGPSLLPSSRLVCLFLGVSCL